jgi:ubiquitin-conjugating enzyme E2 D/E
MSTKRIQKEWMELIKSPIPGITVGPIAEDDLLRWKGTLTGTNDSPYKGGNFGLSIEFDESYPFKAPKVKFTTRIYHCNISAEGEICMDLLKNDQWKPSTRLSHVLVAIQYLLDHPNPDDPLDADAAELYRNDLKKYLKNAKDTTKQYAR